MPQTAADDRIDALLAGLNGPQREAVVHGDGPLLVLAGAGSGKTRVLTHRIAYLVHTGRRGPSEILAITFTNKAAQEMRERVEVLLGHSTRGDVGHDVPRRLRADAARRGAAAGLHAPVHDLRPGRLRGAWSSAASTSSASTPSASRPPPLQHQISDAKNKLRDAAAYRQLVGSYFEQTVADVFELYEQRLHRMNAMDFDDLLVRTVNVLELFPEVRARYRAAFRHVLVDEYQDTNHAQYRLLQLLAGEHRNLAVVGDDDQSIYGFRGADIRNILDFQDDFPTRPRSSGSSRTTARRRRSSTRPTRSSRTTAGGWARRCGPTSAQGDPIKIRELDDEHAEARYVVGEIERLVDEGVSRAEIAVFYRTNAQSRVLEDTLVRREIGYQVIGGTKFYERAEVKDAIAYLTVLANPQDVVSFTRVANSPKRGIGQTSLSRVLAHAETMGITRLGRRRRRRAAVPGPGHRGRRARSARFMATMAALRERAERGRPGRRPARGAAARDRLPRRARGRAHDRGPGPAGEPAGARRGRARVRRRAPEDGRGPLDVFLQQVALVADADTRRDDEGLVTLMTLHNAKGLEYPIVFIIGCEEGVFPHSRSLDEGTLEEERRLCYVGHHARRCATST